MDTVSDSPGPERVLVELSEDERRLLEAGLREWGGAARPTMPLVRLLGLRTIDDFYNTVDRLDSDLAATSALAPLDWVRALLATEIALVSDLFGSGVDWPTTTGMSDEKSLATLRTLQRKLGSLVHGFDPSSENWTL